MATLDTTRDVLREFVRVVEESGGLVVNGDGLPAPTAEDGWSDLGAVYIKACRALGRTPRYEKSGPSPATVVYPEGPATVNGDVREAIQETLHCHWDAARMLAAKTYVPGENWDDQIFSNLVLIDNWLHGTAHTPEHRLQPEPEGSPP